jgi:hypothetical protein
VTSSSASRTAASPGQYSADRWTARGSSRHGQSGDLARVDLQIDAVTHRVTGTVAAQKAGGNS